MEVDQSRPGPPRRECALDHVIPGETRPPEPSAERFLRPDVVAREDLEPADPPEEDVLSRPAPDASQRAQGCDRGVIIQPGDALEIETTAGDAARQLDHGQGLRSTEPESLERV